MDDEVLQQSKLEKNTPSLEHAETALKRFVNRIDALYSEQSHEMAGIPFGLKLLDQRTSGLHAGDLIIVAGAGGIGKSSFALGVCENIAIEARLPVAMFSLEATSDRVISRLVGSVGKLNGHEAFSLGQMNEDGWNRLTYALGKIQASPFHMYCHPGLKIDDLLDSAIALHAEIGKFGAIVIDGLEALSAASSEAKSAITKKLKILAVKLDCAVIVTEQIASDRLENRPNHRPTLKDLSDREIENDADLVLLIYCDQKYNLDSQDRGIAEIIIAKQRNGPLGPVQVIFLEDFCRFETIAIPDY